MAHNLTETSDREIYECYVSNWCAWDHGDKWGRDDVDKDFPAEPQPSRQEVLKANTLNKFIEKVDDPIARKLKGLLGSLKCSTASRRQEI